MKITEIPFRASALILSLTLVAGCKLLNDGVETGFTGGPANASGSPPSIWGDAERSALVGANYLFQPEAEDADGDVLKFSIENKPFWASFDTTTGRLQGVPGQEDVGRNRNIVISVSDQASVASLASFDISVQTAAVADDGNSGGTGDASAPPTISGEPNTSVVADAQYWFRPEATDPEGDDLSFSIVNKPAWANFITTTGRLSGWPSLSDVGTSAPIEISVTDGASVAALPRFTITVEAVGSKSFGLSWNAPVANEDGTPLTDLAGYRIYYGMSPGEYSETIELDSPGVTSYTIDGLAPGTYYLAMTSINGSDIESRRTQEISFTP